MTIGVIKVPYSLEFFKLYPVAITWSAGAITADILITGTLVYHLVSFASRSERFAST